MIIAQINKIQYEVSLNQYLYLDYQKNWTNNAPIFVDEVLILNEEIGTPYVKGAKIQLEFIKHGKHKKIIVFKYKPKKNYHKKIGHRQKYTLVKVVAIFLNDKKLFVEKKIAPTIKKETKVNKQPIKKQVEKNKQSSLKNNAPKQKVVKKVIPKTTKKQIKKPVKKTTVKKSSKTIKSATKSKSNALKSKPKSIKKISKPKAKVTKKAK